MKGLKDEVVQFVSLLLPLKVLVCKAQTKHETSGWKALLSLLIYETKHLATDNPLQHYKYPSQKLYNLTPCVQKTKKLLREGLLNRFWSRYDINSKHSLAFDMQLFLHPVFKDLHSVRKVVIGIHRNKGLSAQSANTKAENIISKIRTKVYHLALQSMYTDQLGEKYAHEAPSQLTPSMEEAVELGFGQVSQPQIDESLICAQDIVQAEMITYQDEVCHIYFFHDNSFNQSV